MWKTYLLWRTAHLKAQDWRGREPALHIKHKGFTVAFARNVGVVGNEGRRWREDGAISKCPEMHRRDLEIRHQGKADDGKRHNPAFHFSSDNDGYYWLFDYYIH